MSVCALLVTAVVVPWSPPAGATDPADVEITTDAAEADPGASFGIPVDTDNLALQFERWLDRHAEWSKPLEEYGRNNLVRVNRDGYTFDDYRRGLSELEASLRSKDDPYIDLFSLLEPLCQSYLTSDDATRHRVRQIVAESEMTRWIQYYAASLSAKISGPSDSARLRLGLAAISIGDCGSDYRDTTNILVDLHVRAEAAGLDPEPHFSAVADLSSNNTTSGGCPSVAELLRDFDSHPMLRERRARDEPN